MRKLLIAYAVFLVLMPTLWLGFGETLAPLILSRYLPPVVWLLPLIALFPFLRKKSDALVWLALSGFVLGYHMGFCLPWGTSGQSNLRVTTFNMKEGQRGDIAPFLQQGRFDVIALQEARIPEEGPEGPDPVPALGQALPDHGLVRGGIRNELAIFSAHPMLDSRHVDLGGKSQALVALLSVEGKQVRVVNVHLRTGDLLGRWNERRFYHETATARRLQFAALEELISDGEPTILLGDFNTPPHSEGSALLSKYLRDTFWVGGFGYGYTFDDDYPCLRIDYIWASPQMGVVSSQVLKPHLSDHRPLLTELSL